MTIVAKGVVSEKTERREGAIVRVDFEEDGGSVTIQVPKSPFDHFRVQDFVVGEEVEVSISNKGD